MVKWQGLSLDLDNTNFSNNSLDIVELIKLNQWTLDPLKKTLTDPSGKCINLEEKPMLLLVYLAKMRGEIVTRDQLIEHVWNNRYIDDRTINATISRLRKKLGGEKNDFIETLTKVGYSLTCNVEFIEKGAPEPVNVAAQNNKQKSTKLTLVKLFIIFTTLVIFVGVWLLINEPTPTKKTLTPTDVTIEPLTYMKGWEYSPVLSKDKTLLAFVHATSKEPNSNIIVQHIANKKTLAIEPNARTRAPAWAPDGNTLYYQTYYQEQCWIKKINISANLTLGESKKVTSCGVLYSDTNMFVSRDNKWLYYAFTESALLPTNIKRFNLHNKQTETLTAPPVKLQGDFVFSLSFDHSMLAFIREYDDMSQEIMVLNLSSGELTSLAKFDYIVNSLAWTESDKEIAFISYDNTLHLINVKTKDIAKLYQHSKKIKDPLFISKNELLLSFGDPFTANIKQIDLNHPEPKSQSLVSSAFKDHSAAYFKTANNDKIAFVSNRSGSYQIWLKETNALTQLSHFDNKPYITRMSFSANGEKLLIKLDEKWHIFNIETANLIKLKRSAKLIRSPIWQCHSNDNILIIADNNGIWNLHSLNVITQKTQKLSTGLTSINSDCLNNKYYASIIENKGIHQLNNDWTINQSLHYFPEIPVAFDRQWAVGNNAIYRRDDDGNIWQFDLLTNSNKKILIKKIGHASINYFSLSIQHNIMLINELSIADTFIGKLTLPE